MGKFDGVLLVSDFDDTLYGSDFHVSETDRAAITSFIGKGGWFTIATGRAYTTFTPQLKQERLVVNAPVILSNGSALYDYQQNRMLKQTFLRSRVAADLQLLVTRFPSLGFEAYHGEDIYVHNANAVTWAHLERAKCTCVQCPIAQMPLPFTKILFQQENDVLVQVQAYILENWGDAYEAIFSNRRLLELTEKGSTKGGMVKALISYFDMEPDDVYCVGDNMNDIPMLALSAVPFAPSNCAREVKEWGARIMPSCDDGCIAAVIRALNGRY